jgi:DNA polymerase elongation subunit (family B)
MKHFLVFDIETCPLDWDTFSDSQKEYWLRGTKDDDEIQNRMFMRSLTPLTGQVLCIALMVVEYDSDNNRFEIVKRGVLANNPDRSTEEITDEMLVNDVKMQLSTEKKMLEDFWKILVHYNWPTLISFNGRMFDAPFLMMRSAVHHIRPPYNLMAGTKFNYPNHIDLIDELTFYSPVLYGATKKFNFDFYAHSFGITSPKAQGVNGALVPEMYAEGRIKEISEYCMRDVVATYELFLFWNEYLNFKGI